MTAKEIQTQFDKRATRAKEQYAKDQQAIYRMQQRAASAPPGPGYSQNYGGLAGPYTPYGNFPSLSTTEQYQQRMEEECDYIPNSPKPPRSMNQIIDDALTDHLIYGVRRHWKCILLYLFIAVCIYGRISRRAAEPVVSVVYTPAYTYATPEVFAWDYDDDLEGYRYPAIYLPTAEVNLCTTEAASYYYTIEIPASLFYRNF